uniref:Endoplasmic reticulum-Golgi intermediate compartment protein n=1 Tax=Bos indicus x Bos taurus TaxID=30522 RepID=A0A4W2E0I8_BOBOX
MPFDFRRFDIYRKVPKDLTQPTYTGAIISVCCCLFILFLFLSELTGFITTEIEAGRRETTQQMRLDVRASDRGRRSLRPRANQPAHPLTRAGPTPSPGARVNELYVDDPDKDSGGKIDVSLNISLPNLHCELVGLDIQDEMGRHEVGHIDNSMKIPLNNGVGCRFEGQFSINKVPGNFHVSTHSATAQPQNPDMTHVIHKLSFGDTLQGQASSGSQSPGLRVCMRCLPSPQRPRRFQRSRGSRQTHLQPPRLPRLHPEDRAHGLRRQERQAAVLLPVHGGQQGVRRLQPHGPHHPRHLVPLRPEPHHGQVHGETAASVPVHHHDLCHHWWDLHCGRHSGLVYLYSLGGLEEDPAGQDALMTCPAPRPRTRETTSPALHPISSCPLSGPKPGCVPNLILDKLHCLKLGHPFLSLRSPKTRDKARTAWGHTPGRGAVPSLLGGSPDPCQSARSQALTISQPSRFGPTGHLGSLLGRQPADLGSRFWTRLPKGTSHLAPSTKYGTSQAGP